MLPKDKILSISEDLIGEDLNEEFAVVECTELGYLNDPDFTSVKVKKMSQLYQTNESG